MSDLRTRSDIDRLLRRFYTSAFEDDLLRHVFVDVAGMDLEQHLPVIGDFWEKVLFNTVEYTGRAMAVHRRLHVLEPLTPARFARWLQLWAAAVDALYAGPVADQAKAHAGRTATAIQRNLPEVGQPVPRELPLRPVARGA